MYSSCKANFKGKLLTYLTEESDAKQLLRLVLVEYRHGKTDRMEEMLLDEGLLCTVSSLRAVNACDVTCLKLASVEARSVSCCCCSGLLRHIL